MISVFSRTSFIMSVMLRTSVATIREDAPRLQRLNSVLYSTSVCPGQCSNGLLLSQPCRERESSQHARLQGYDQGRATSLGLQSWENRNHSIPPDLCGSTRLSQLYQGRGSEPLTSILPLAYVVENNFRGGIPIIVVIRSTPPGVGKLCHPHPWVLHSPLTRIEEDGFTSLIQSLCLWEVSVYPASNHRKTFAVKEKFNILCIWLPVHGLG